MQTLNPFGFRPSYNPTGLDRGKQYTIANAYATALYKGQPVLLASTGVIQVGAATGDLLGVFQGCEYQDAGTGKWVESNYWPASQNTVSGSAIRAWVLDDPSIVYAVQCDGTAAQSAVGSQAFTSNATANTGTGLSQATLGVAGTLTNSGQAQWRIVGFDLDVANAVGDAYPVVQVQLAMHQFIANKVAV
jgi:hypothetical protein